jgi:hypothetical protein
MIRYDLRCDRGHEFDGWFVDSTAFDTQRAQRLVACTHCGSVDIDKQIMAPGIPAKSNKKSTANIAGGVIDPEARRMLALMRELRQQVETNAEYVGSQFAEEARKIHYDEAEKRGIYGEASQDDARALIEEGIEVHALPRLPEDTN